MATPLAVEQPTRSGLMPSSPALDLAAVYRQHARQVARWAGRLLGPHADIEDAVQEVFMVVQRRLPQFRAETGQLETWLYRITQHVVQNRRRRERWRRWLGGSAADVAGGIPSSQPGPAQLLELRQAADDVYAVLDLLEEKYRTVLILYELEGLTGEEIAAMTGKRVGTVWVLLHRARARFIERAREGTVKKA